MDVKRKSSKAGYFKDLPDEIKGTVSSIKRMINDSVQHLQDDEDWECIRKCDYCQHQLSKFCVSSEQKGFIGSCIVWKDGKDKFEACIQVTASLFNPCNDETERNLNKYIASVFKTVSKDVEEKFKLKMKTDEDHDNHECFFVCISGEDAANIWERLSDETKKLHTEFTNVPTDVFSYYYNESKLPFEDYLTEKKNNKSKKNTEKKHGKCITICDDKCDEHMETYSEAAERSNSKSAFMQVAKSIIDDHSAGKKVSSSRVKALVNVINDKLIHGWAPGYKSLRVTLSDYQTFPSVDFKVPKITPDFVERFIAGRETMSGFLHRNPEITMRISSRVFETAKKPEDIFRFFKAALKYYSIDIDKYGVSLMTEIKKMGHEMHHLIVSTKLIALVTCPITMLFSFDDVDMTDIKVFKLSRDDIKTVNAFMRNITKSYSAPAKEQKKIIADVKAMVKALRECSMDDQNKRDMNSFGESLEIYYYNGYSKEISDAQYTFEYNNIDHDWHRKQGNGQLRYLQEKFGVRKLKKIPRDIIAYCQIEAEAIKDANDKMMIASYCLGKLEIVEWYIELIDSGSTKYVVPHNRPYLVNMKTQLMACYKKIMETPIPKKRPIIDIEYPAGFEG